jgi:hypothetical protein
MSSELIFTLKFNVKLTFANIFKYKSLKFTESIDSKTNFLTIEPNIQLQIEIVVYNSKIDFYSQI